METSFERCWVLTQNVDGFHRAAGSKIVRPDVVLFEEVLPRAKSALLDQEVRRGFDVVFSIGTSSLFPYITAPVLMTSARRGTTVEINPARTSLSDVVDVRLAMGAVAASEALWAARDQWRHT
jgi:NAD-dependent deacetylase